MVPLEHLNRCRMGAECPVQDPLTLRRPIREPLVTCGLLGPRNAASEG